MTWHFLLLTQSGRAVILPGLSGGADRIGKEGSVLNREHVLVVDEISDTAEVLQAVLEPRGVTVNRVSRRGRTQFPTFENRPTLVVCDAESMSEAEIAHGTLATEGMAPGGNWQSVPQIIIGTLRPVGVDRTNIHTVNLENEETAVRHVERRYLQKPFQFAELIQAIESLIGSRAA